VSHLTLGQAVRGGGPPHSGANSAARQRVSRAQPRPDGRVAWTLVYLGFLGYVFAITTYKLPIGDSSIVAAMIGLLLLERGWRLPGLIRWAVVFLGWCALGYLQTDFPGVVWENVIFLAKLCLIMLVAANALRSPAQIRFFMIFFLACYALFPVRGTIVNYFVTHDTHHGRAVWNYIYANPNDLAALSLLLLSVAAALHATERTAWVRISAVAGIATLPVLILMTQSRGGVIALCVFAVCSLSAQGRRLRTPLLATGLALGVIAVAPSDVWKRMKGLTQVAESVDRVDPEGSGKARFEIWQVAIGIIGDHPWTGVGWGAYPMAHAQFGLELGQPDTHSTYLNGLAEAGYPGLVLFLTLLWSAVREAEKARRLCRVSQPHVALQLRYLELGLLAFLIAGVFGSYAKLSFLYLHLMLVWAVAQNATRALQSAPTPIRRAPRRWA